MNYKIIDHTADLAIEVWGKTMAELFQNAALALFDLMVFTDMIEAKREMKIEAAAGDDEALLVQWLSEFLYRVDTEQFLAKEIEITRLEPGKVSAVARGETLDRTKHRTRREIKAVTYHDLKIQKTAGNVSAHILFDL